MKPMLKYRGGKSRELSEIKKYIINKRYHLFKIIIPHAFITVKFSCEKVCYKL